MFGKQQTLEMLVSELDPPHRMVIHAADGPVSYSTEFTLEPHGDDTELIMRFAAQHESANPLQLVAWAAFGCVGLVFTRKSSRG